MKKIEERNGLKIVKSTKKFPISNNIVWFSLVGFHGISTIIGYSMPNPVYKHTHTHTRTHTHIYILDIYDL